MSARSSWRARFSQWSKPRREADVAWAIGKGGSLGQWCIPAAAALSWMVLASCLAGRALKSACWALFVALPSGVILLGLGGGARILANMGSNGALALNKKTLELESWLRITDFRVFITIKKLLMDARGLPVFRWFWSWDLAISIGAALSLRGKDNRWGMNAYSAAWGAQWRASALIWPGSGTPMVYLYEFLPDDMELSRSAIQPMGWAGARLGFERKASAIDHIRKHAMASVSFAWARQAAEAAAAAECKAALNQDVPSAVARGSEGGHRL